MFLHLLRLPLLNFLSSVNSTPLTSLRGAVRVLSGIDGDSGTCADLYFPVKQDEVDLILTETVKEAPSHKTSDMVASVCSFISWKSC